MAYQIRQSDDGSFYNLLNIDEEGNERVVESGTLNKVQSNKVIAGQTLPVVKEKDTRGTKTPRVQ